MRAREFHNAGAFTRTAFVAINKTATAGGAGDATQVNGEWVDRSPTDQKPFQSAKLVIPFTTTLAAAATLKFAVQFQDATSSAGAGAANYGTAVAATTVATGPGGGGTVLGQAEVDIDLAGAREFVRAQITPDLSAGATDTVEWAALLLLHGGGRAPASQRIATVQAP